MIRKKGLDSFESRIFTVEIHGEILTSNKNDTAKSLEDELWKGIPDHMNVNDIQVRAPIEGEELYSLSYDDVWRIKRSVLAHATYCDNVYEGDKRFGNAYRDITKKLKTKK